MYSTVTHIFSQRDQNAVREHIEHTVAQSHSPHWNAGWPGEGDAALLDAVFSARANYGGADTGVRRVVGRWRAHRAGHLLDDLGVLAEFVARPDELAEILGNRQRVPGNVITKADAVATIAAAFQALGVTHASEVTDSDEHRRAFVTVTGMGAKSWECFLFLAGPRSRAALDVVRAFASDAVGRELDDESTRLLLVATADTLGVEFAALEHAVWRFARRVPKRRPSPQLTETG